MLTTACPEPEVLWFEEGLPEARHELASKTDDATTPSTTHDDHCLADIKLTVLPGGLQRSVGRIAHLR
jgi:hypothetical protein